MRRRADAALAVHEYFTVTVSKVSLKQIKERSKSLFARTAKAVSTLDRFATALQMALGLNGKRPAWKPGATIGETIMVQAVAQLVQAARRPSSHFERW